MNVLEVTASEQQQAEDVAKAAGVMQHFAQRDGFAIRRNLGNKFANVVIERKKTLFGGEDHTCRGKLLRDAPHVKNRLRRDRHAELEAGRAITLFVDECAIAHHAERTAGRIRLVERRKHLIDLAL